MLKATWETVQDGLIAVLAEHLPARLAALGAPAIVAGLITPDGQVASTDDSILIVYHNTARGDRHSDWADSVLHFTLYLGRFHEDEMLARRACANTEAAVVQVLTDHLDAAGVQEVQIGDSVPWSGKNEGTFLKVLELPISCRVRVSRSVTGATPDV